MDTTGLDDISDTYTIKNTGVITIAGNSTLNLSSEVGNYTIKNIGTMTVNNDTLNFNSKGGSFMVSNTGTITVNNCAFKGSSNALTAQAFLSFMNGDDLSNNRLKNITIPLIFLNEIFLFAEKSRFFHSYPIT